MRLAGDPVALLCAGSGSRGDRQLPPHIRSDSRFLLQQCTFEYHEGSKNNRSTITPRYPEAENPFRAQLERVKSIRHFLGRQAANNPGLCNSEESLPMCFPETPPCQSRKVSSGSVMEKHAAKCPWEGGSKKVAFGSSGKYSFVKSMDCFGLGLRGNKQACKEGDLCCTTKTFGHALYPEAMVGSRVEAQSLGVHGSLPAFRQVTPPFHLFWNKDQRDKKETPVFQLGESPIPHTSS